MLATHAEVCIDGNVRVAHLCERRLCGRRPSCFGGVGVHFRLSDGLNGGSMLRQGVVPLLRQTHVALHVNIRNEGD